MEKEAAHRSTAWSMLLTAALLAVHFSFLIPPALAAQFYPSDRLSSGLITCLCQDSRGFLWIGTEYGLNKFDGYRFTHYLHHPDDSASLVHNEVVALHVDDEGTLWVGTARGLSRYDAQADRFRSYRFPDDRHPRVNSLLTAADGTLLIGTAGYGLYTLHRGTTDVHYETAMNARNVDRFYSRVFIDREGFLWRSSHTDTITRYDIRGALGGAAATPAPPGGATDFASPYGQPITFLDYSPSALLIVCQNGILRYDYRAQRLTDAGFTLAVGGQQPDVATAIIDQDGNIFLGTTMNGLLVIRRGEQQAEHVGGTAFAQQLAQANVRAALDDSHHNLWVACHNKGLLLLNPDGEAFATWRLSAQLQSTVGSTTAIVPDDDGGIYCCVYPGGIYRFDAEGRVTAHPRAPEGVRTIHRDAQGRYWIGTEHTLYRYDPTSGTAEALGTFSGRGLTCMADDGAGTLYVGVFGMGLHIVDTATGEVEVQSMSYTGRPGGYLSNNWIRSLFVDSRGMLWICTADGISMMKPAGRVFNSQRWNQLLEGKQCFTACELPDGNILIGAEDGLYLYDRQRNAVAPLPGGEPLQDKLICAMVCDSRGTVWISTNMGIWQLPAGAGRFIAHTSGNGLRTREYVMGAALHVRATDERLFFGTVDGVTTFTPAAVVADTMAPGPLFMTRLLVNGAARPLPTDGGRLSLPYSDNSLQMEFSLLDYHDAENISFQWRINGQRAWHALAEGDNQLALNELQPGSYLVEVRAASNGRLSADSYRLTVDIAQPWYRTTWAYLLYLAIAAFVVGLIVYTYIRQQRRNMEETKMRFLINATHDIRSPLTLIMGAVDKLKGGGGNLQAPIDTIDRNAQRLLTLVGQILDERKIDKGQMRLHCAATDLVEFVGGIVKLYEFGAAQRSITFTYRHPATRVEAWIDRTQFDKVVSNLLSNAFKYTPDGGEIAVDLQLTDLPFTIGSAPAQLNRQSVNRQSVNITVTDSGLGFNDDHTEKYFERFYMGKNSRDLHIDGTGIGLNLSRALTEMHGGHIEALNRKDGHSGAILKVTLPLGNAHLSPDQLATDDEAADIRPAKDRPVPTTGVHLLVVDDDAEIRRYIADELGRWYHIMQAADGREALKLLLTQRVDLVVSDVMMPQMDGMTLLRSVKQNPQVSHVPVILLTSKAEVEYRLEGLRKGADAYLAKPFQMEELHVLIDNLLDGVRRLRGKFSGALEQQERVEQIEVRGNNDALMERVMRAVNAHLGDPDLTVDTLTQEIGISRAQLHRKMKEITGVSTTEFIRNLRLEQAARLISEKKINITQVAYSVGFNNQTHFSTVFKKHFGMTPTEFAARGGQPQ